MSHDIFISHSAKDKLAADTVCSSLELAGIRCWVAPRDVQPGLNYAGQINRAIKGSRVILLIFSGNANHSDNVLREVELAARHTIHILSFKIEETPVSDDLGYYLSAPHWLDAVTPPVQQHLGKLTSSLGTLLLAEETTPPDNGSPRSNSQETASFRPAAERSPRETKDEVSHIAITQRTPLTKKLRFDTDQKRKWREQLDWSKRLFSSYSPFFWALLCSCEHNIHSIMLWSRCCYF